MPAKSKAQRRFMGMVRAAQQGKKPASPEVAKAAKGMSKKSAEDYAKTSEKGLPEKVKNEDLSPTDFGDDTNNDIKFEEQKLREFIRRSIAEDKWIQKAINPEHKGYCTPMSKSTCTPRRKALAKRFKKGIENEEFDNYAEYNEPPIANNQENELEEDIIPKKKNLTPYQKFFKSALEKFGVDSPDELTPKMKDNFFNYIDNNWKSEEEK